MSDAFPRSIISCTRALPQLLHVQQSLPVESAARGAVLPLEIFVTGKIVCFIAAVNEDGMLLGRSWVY